jgi:hypothetical protein
MIGTSMRGAIGLAAVVLVTAVGGAARAEEGLSAPLTDRQALGLVRAVYLEVQDRVSGGCWTGVSSIRQSVESSLRQTGITVYDEPLVYDAPFSIRLAVAAFGGRTGSGGSCSVTLTVTAFSPAVVGSLQGRGPQMALDAVLFDRKGMLLGTRLDERIAQQFETWLTEFGGDVLAGRRDPRVRAIADSRAGGPQALTVREWERQRR